MFRVSKTRFFLLLLIILVIICTLRYFKPIPLAEFHADQSLPAFPAHQVELPWPSYGHGAVGALGYGLLASSPQLQPKPIASTAKVLTALAVLDKKPLAPGQSAPLITITDEDVAAYKQARAQGQSVLEVKAGEKLTEYQALQALLIPSANNVAAILANWAFGSLDNYLTYVNQKAKAMGMKNTLFADASGYSPNTVSTASDAVIMGLSALKNPTVVSIINQSKIKLPIAGSVKNVNWLLGDSGIIGIKTGNTDQAGGCYLLAAKRIIKGQPVTVVTAVVNEPDLVTAMTHAKKLLLAVDKNFVLIKEDFTGSYTTKWGAIARIRQKNIETLTWAGEPSKASSTIVDLPAGSGSGSLAGIVTRKNAGYVKSEEVHLAQPIASPSFWWRIFR